MKITRSISIILLIIGNLCFAATYYVATTGSNSNTGTIGSPWLTIDYAESRMNDGDTCLVRGGTYYESVITTDSGSSGNHITIKSYPTETAIIDGGTLVTGWTQCSGPNDFLTLAGVDINTPGFVGNANYASIYKATYTSSQVSSTANVHFVEDNTFLFKASSPTQVSHVYDDALSYKAVPSGNYSQSAYIADAALTQPNDFWNGAIVKVYRQSNNTIYSRTVTDFDAATDKLILSSALAWSLTSGDRYVIQNHWSLMDKAGTVYHTTTAVGGVYTAYIWPRDAADLTAKIKALKREVGIQLYYSQYLTYEDLIIQNIAPSTGTAAYNGGGIVKPYTAAEVVREVWVRGCMFRNIVCSGSGGAISFICPRACEVNNCTITDVRDGFGVQFAKNNSRGNSSKITNCYFDRIDETSIKPTGNDQLEVSHNIMGEASTHGNAFSSYTLNHQILFAHNYVTRANNAVATHDTNNIYIFGNVLEADDASGSLNVWAYASDNMEGDIYILQNTVINAYSSTAISINDSLAPSNDPCLVIMNNIADGMVIYNAWYPVMTHTYNLYLDKSKYQNNQAQGSDWDNSWSAGTGEWFEDENHAAVFMNSAVYDYNLPAESNAVAAGGDISAYTAKMLTIWPVYDFNDDIAGTAWASPRSIGAYETVGAPAPVDSDPPDPCTMTFTAMTALDSNTITMTATTATDGKSAVDYNFAETTGNKGGADSGWQASTTYTLGSLIENTQYGFRVYARDATSLVSTDASESISVTTKAKDRTDNRIALRGRYGE